MCLSSSGSVHTPKLGLTSDIDMRPDAYFNTNRSSCTTDHSWSQLLGSHPRSAKLLLILHEPPLGVLQSYTIICRLYVVEQKVHSNIPSLK